MVTVTGFSGYAALLPTAPMWVVAGGSGELGAGLVNGVLLLATVLAQFTVPALVHRLGHAAVVVAGLLLLGLPSPLYLLSDDLWWVLLLSTVRGIGFGILTVTGAAMVAHLVPHHQRGRAIGLYGLAVALPNLGLLPVTPWLAEAAGYGWVFALAALPVVGIPWAVPLGRRVDAEVAAQHAEDTEFPRPIWSPSFLMGVLPPTLQLFAVTLAGGALLTFVPQMVGAGGLSTVVLLLLGLTGAVSRWLAGYAADRFGARRFLTPLLVLTMLAMTVTAFGLESSTGLLVAGVTVVGICYGALQNFTMVRAFDKVGTREVSAASAVWNAGFDAGTGFGSVTMGALAAAYTFPTGLIVLGVVALLAAPLTLLPRGGRSDSAAG